MAECVHAIPGRARFRVPALRHSDTVADALRHRLDGVHGVRRIDIRRQAASLIVHFDPRMLDIVALHGLVLGQIPDLAPPAPSSPPSHQPSPAQSAPSQPTPCRIRQAVRYVSGIAGAAALNAVLERAVKAGVGVVLRSARIPI